MAFTRSITAVLLSGSLLASPVVFGRPQPKKGEFGYLQQSKHARFQRSERVDRSIFTIGRRFMSYEDKLDLRPLLSLGKHDHVLELGAGNLRAALEFANGDFSASQGPVFRHLRKNRPHITAITAEKYDDQPTPSGRPVDPKAPRTVYVKGETYRLTGSVPRRAVQNTSGLTARVGRYFEELRANRLTKKHGLFAFVMDYEGVLRYSQHTDQVGQKLSEIMKPGAQLSWTGNNLQRAVVNAERIAVDVNPYLIASGAFRSVEGSGNLERTNAPWVTPALDDNLALR